MTTSFYVRTGLKLVTNLGISNMVFNTVKATTPANSHPVSKVCTFVGAVVVTNMISIKANDYIDKAMDDFEASMNYHRQQNQKF